MLPVCVCKCVQSSSQSFAKSSSPSLIEFTVFIIYIRIARFFEFSITLAQISSTGFRHYFIVFSTANSIYYNHPKAKQKNSPHSSENTIIITYYIYIFSTIHNLFAIWLNIGYKCFSSRSPKRFFFFAKILLFPLNEQ